MKNLNRGLAFACLSLTILCLNFSNTNAQPLNRDSALMYGVAPIPHGFAHNDYLHKHPLYDALGNGFTNIEADIFLKNGKLIVAHIFPYFKGNRTLEMLYLAPLAERIAKNNGRVYPRYSSPIILMIDIKTNGDKTYGMLKPLLEKYRWMLTHCEDGHVVYGAVTIVLSGHKPYELIENEQNPLAFIDEDLRQMHEDSVNHHVFAMASCKYSQLLNWNGKDTISNAERQKLLTYVARAHKIGAKVRLWASPENKNVWDTLLSCGVDLINTDQLDMLKNYFSVQPIATIN
jgi:hypothetical protein